MDTHKVLVTGATGFIGRALCRRLVTKGCQVHVLTRNKEKARLRLPTEVTVYQGLAEIPTDCQFATVINLAGEPLLAGRWTAKRKQMFYGSRIGTTDALYDFFVRAPAPPQLLINGSAIGYYGPHGDELLDEEGSVTNCYSHQLCDAWEASAHRFRQMGTRVCYLRTGVVLGRGGGALARMLLPFKLGLGGKIGSGQQWFSWIHMDDLVGIIEYCMDHTDLHGPVNGTAPEPVTNCQFTEQLAETLHRPAFMAVPSFAMKALLGEMAQEILLTGQRVVPKKALDAGYAFKYRTLSQALNNILRS